MNIKNAIEEAKKDKRIKEILNHGGFLTTGFITLSPKEKIEKWNLSFYDPETEKITSITVSESSKEIGLTDSPIHKKIYKPDELKIKISADDALEKAKNEYKKYNAPLSKILISFQKREKEFWNITFITKIGHLINVQIDAESGEIMKSEETNIFQVEKKTAAS